MSIPRKIPVSVYTGQYIDGLSTNDFSARLAERLVDLHPGRPGAPSVDVCMAAINYLCGHSIRCDIPGTRLSNYMPRTMLYISSTSTPLGEDDRLLMAGLVKYPASISVGNELMTRIMALPEIRVVLGNGYTLVFRPTVDRDVSIGDDPACFVSLVKTPPGDITDAVRCSEFMMYDIEVHGDPVHHYKPHATLSLYFGVKSITINVKPDIFKRFNPNAKYTFVTARILEKLFPVLYAKP